MEAASSRTSARVRAACASWSSGLFRSVSSARSRAALARASSTSVPSSATSESTLTLSCATCTKPPCTAATTSPDSGSSTRSTEIARVPTNGTCPGRNAISPSATRHTTMSATPSYRMRSGETSSTCSGIARSAFLKRLLLREHALHATHVEERLLGYLVELAVDQRLEALDRLLDRHVDALEAGEGLPHEERLREEPLDLPGPRHRDLVLFRELVEPEDRDDVLELLEPLEHLLHSPRARVMPIAHDFGSEDVGGGCERVHGRVDAERGDLAGQLRGRVEVGERG